MAASCFFIGKRLCINRLAKPSGKQRTFDFLVSLRRAIRYATQDALREKLLDQSFQFLKLRRVHIFEADNRTSPFRVEVDRATLP